MSLILVVEKDADFTNQLAVALRAEGHTIDAVASCEAGEEHAAARAPQLVLVSGMLPGAPKLLGRFSKRGGGVGSVVIVPAQMAGEVSAKQFGADIVLPKPMTRSALLGALGLLPQSKAPPAADPALLPDVGAQLTSEEIFGEVLAEVEADAGKRSDRSIGQPTQPSATPQPSMPSTTPLAASNISPPTASFASPAAVPPVASAPKPADATSARPRRRRISNDDIDRKLEETLSGFFPDKLRAAEKAKAAGAPMPAAPKKPKPRRATVPSADEIDDLLDKTLSSLELPRAKRPRREPTSTKPAPAPTPVSPHISPKAPAVTSQPEPLTALSEPVPQPTFPEPPTTSQPPVPSFAAPPPVSSGAPLNLPSAAETMRLSAPLQVPPTPEPPALEPPAIEIPALDAAAPSAEWTPDSALSSDEDILRTGTFDLPALEPLPDVLPPATPEPTSFFPPPATELESPAETFSPTIEVIPVPGLATPEIMAPDLGAPDTAPPQTAPPQASFELPDLPPADGWSVSSFDEVPTPQSSAQPELGLPSIPAQGIDERRPSFDEPAFDQPTFDEPAYDQHGLDQPADGPSHHQPGSFGAPPTDSFAPPVDVAAPEPTASPEAAFSYPTDFESAFALPAGAEDDPGDTGPVGFSPDPTETVEPEDTASLQRTLEGVLQIRNGTAASSKAGIPFGDYRLLDRVAVGGMAEVWRAQRRGVEGFQKIVAIKKILSHLTGSQDFITMFIDEAKLAAQLNHANIIQIYDLGKVEDDFFIAMEFVDGRDLRSIQNQAKDKGEKLPLGLCLIITAALARALDYAHRKRDFDHRELGLVHRDVSPQNVLISYEGEIKLCDFGIVKAVAKASSTQMGALKGKLQYMSPEQAWGKEVDARSDIFSLGSVFFELLTGQRLFTGDSEIGVLDAVRDCRVQSPRNVDPNVPVEVEAIVMRALAATPETRYQTAGEMEKDITAVLEQLRPAVGQGDLTEMMARLFGPHESSQASTDSSFSMAAQAEIPSFQRLESGSTTPSGRNDSAAGIGNQASPPAAMEAKKAKKEPSGGSRAWIIAAIVLVALAAVVLILVMALGGSSGDQGSPKPAVTPPAVLTPPPPQEAEAGTDQEEAAAQDQEAQGQGAQDQDAPRQDAPGQDAQGQATSDAKAPADGAADDEKLPLGADYEQLIQDALASEQQKLEENFEAEKRRIEQELSKVRDSEKEGGGG